MRTIGIAELKASLSETLARVKAGEEILITEHGRPVAKVMPLPPSTPAAFASEELVRSGVLRAPDRALGEDFWGLPRGEDAEGLAREALTAERQEAE